MRDPQAPTGLGPGLPGLCLAVGLCHQARCSSEAPCMRGSGKGRRSTQMCLRQLISASPKQGGVVDPQHRRGPWAAVFYGGGGCSCTNCLQAEASPDLRCGSVPGALQRAAPWREAPWAGVRLPAPCGMAMTGCCSPKPSWEQCYRGKGSPSLGLALWQGFAALPAVFILALMCATRDGVSLSACWVFPAVCPCAQFPCSGALAASHSLCPISYPPFPLDPSPIRTVSSQPCVKSHLFFQLLGWI